MYSYGQATGAAALQGLMTGAWVAAGELAPAKRRLTRTGTVVALSGIGSIKDWAFPDDKPTAGTACCTSSTTPADDGTACCTRSATPADDTSDSAPEPISKARMVAAGAGIAISVATMVAGRRLEKRWLTALTRDGHAHPYRALAVRMGLISFAATLPSRLIRAHEARHRG